jgi:hypothetical protein
VKNQLLAATLLLVHLAAIAFLMRCWIAQRQQVQQQLLLLRPQDKYR